MNINHKQIISLSFFGLLIFVLFQLVSIFKPFFEAFFWAGILAFAFYPVHSRVLGLVKRQRPAALISTFMIVIIVILPSIFVIEKLVAQGIDLFNFLSQGGWQRVTDAIRNSPLARKYYAFFADYLGAHAQDWPARLTPALAGFTTAQIAATTKNLAWIALNFVLTAFLIFFFLKDGRRMVASCYKLVPLEEKDKAEIFSKIVETFESVIRGQFLTSLVQSVLCGVTFLVLGLPAPHFFGFLTFIATLIPVLGAAGIWVPFCVYLFAVQDTTRAVILLVVGVLLISGIDNVLKPLLIGERIKMPIFLLLFGVLGGLQAYGFTGIFLGPLFITLFFALVRIYQERYVHGSGA